MSSSTEDPEGQKQEMMKKKTPLASQSFAFERASYRAPEMESWSIRDAMVKRTGLEDGPVGMSEPRKGSWATPWTTPSVGVSTDSGFVMGRLGPLAMEVRTQDGGAEKSIHPFDISLKEAASTRTSNDDSLSTDRPEESANPFSDTRTPSRSKATHKPRTLQPRTTDSLGLLGTTRMASTSTSTSGAQIRQPVTAAGTLRRQIVYSPDHASILGASAPSTRCTNAETNIDRKITTLQRPIPQSPDGGYDTLAKALDARSGMTTTNNARDTRPMTTSSRTESTANSTIPTAPRAARGVNTAASANGTHTRQPVTTASGPTTSRSITTATGTFGIAGLSTPRPATAHPEVPASGARPAGKVKASTSVGSSPAGRAGGGIGSSLARKPSNAKSGPRTAETPAPANAPYSATKVNSSKARNNSNPEVVPSQLRSTPASTTPISCPPKHPRETIEYEQSPALKSSASVSQPVEPVSVQNSVGPTLDRSKFKPIALPRSSVSTTQDKPDLSVQDTSVATNVSGQKRKRDDEVVDMTDPNRWIRISIQQRVIKVEANDGPEVVHSPAQSQPPLIVASPVRIESEPEGHTRPSSSAGDIRQPSSRPRKKARWYYASTPESEPRDSSPEIVLAKAAETFVSRSAKTKASKDITRTYAELKKGIPVRETTTRSPNKDKSDSNRKWHGYYPKSNDGNLMAALQDRLESTVSRGCSQRSYKRAREIIQSPARVFHVGDDRCLPCRTWARPTTLPENFEIWPCISVDGGKCTRCTLAHDVCSFTAVTTVGNESGTIVVDLGRPALSDASITGSVTSAPVTVAEPLPQPANERPTTSTLTASAASNSHKHPADASDPGRQQTTPSSDRTISNSPPPKDPSVNPTRPESIPGSSIPTMQVSSVPIQSQPSTQRQRLGDIIRMTAETLLELGEEVRNNPICADAAERLQLELDILSSTQRRLSLIEKQT